MTDQQTHHDAGGNARLIAHLNRIEGLILRSEVDLPDRVPTVVAVPTAKLLAMIDALDPDAMRAYLRETAPDFVADSLRPDYAEGGVTAALIEREVPEADSPEDVDEPRRLCDPITAEQLADLREAGRTLGESWSTLVEAGRAFNAAVRDGARR